MLTALAAHRGGDQVTHPAPGVNVLGREQTVIATQMHAATQAKCLTEQTCGDAAGGRCRDCIGEEGPHVGASPGLGYLQCSRNSIGARRLHVRERIEHRGFLVEVCRDPPAGVVIAERIQADMCLAPQMSINGLRCQREVRPLRLDSSPCANSP